MMMKVGAIWAEMIGSDGDDDDDDHKDDDDDDDYNDDDDDDDDDYDDNDDDDDDNDDDERWCNMGQDGINRSALDGGQTAASSQDLKCTTFEHTVVQRTTVHSSAE